MLQQYRNKAHLGALSRTKEGRKKKMAKKLKNLISREKYKEIKKMDHVEMSDFFTKVWQSGYDHCKKEEKAENKAAVTPEDIREMIKDIKGIGEIKLKAIMEQIGTLYE